MEYKQITCREHGGLFTVEKKRGRPPVKCSEDNVCDGVIERKGRRSNPGISKRDIATTRRIATAKQAIQEQSMDEQITETRRAVKRPGKHRPVKPAATPAVVKNNPSVPPAFEAKRILEPQGWKITGRAWFDGEVGSATVLGTRGEEQVSFLWVDGKLDSQHYSMWNSSKPSENGMPRKRLNFDPEELSDAALVKMLAGKRITWWNRLGKTTETCVVGREADKRVKVEHVLNGHGDELARIVTFVDATKSGTGFRSFHVDALLKVV